MSGVSRYYAKNGKEEISNLCIDYHVVRLFTKYNDVNEFHAVTQEHLPE